MEKTGYLESRLWELEECHKENDGNEKTTEYIKNTMKKLWKVFVKNGISPERVANLMWAEDIIDGLELLEESGFKLDVDNLIEKITNVKVIDENWDLLVKKGGDKKKLFKRFVEESRLEIYDMEGWFKRGIDAGSIYRAVKNDLFSWRDDDAVFNNILILIGFGLIEDKAAWNELKIDIGNLADCYTIKYMLESPLRWREIGINPVDYKERYFNVFEKDLIGYGPVAELPSTISIEEYLEWVDFSKYGIKSFERLMKDYEELKGDLSGLAEIYLKKCGYEGKDCNNVRLYQLLEFGESKILDPVKIAELCVDGAAEHIQFVKVIEPKKAKKVFKRRGIPKDTIKKLYTKEDLKKIKEQYRSSRDTFRLYDLV